MGECLTRVCPLLHSFYYPTSRIKRTRSRRHKKLMPFTKNPHFTRFFCFSGISIVGFSPILQSTDIRPGLTPELWTHTLLFSQLRRITSLYTDFFNLNRAFLIQSVKLIWCQVFYARMNPSPVIENYELNDRFIGLFIASKFVSRQTVIF
jgi:hypothetical protein